MSLRMPERSIYLQILLRVRRQGRTYSHGLSIPLQMLQHLRRRDTTYELAKINPTKNHQRRILNR